MKRTTNKNGKYLLQEHYKYCMDACRKLAKKNSKLFAFEESESDSGISVESTAKKSEGSVTAERFIVRMKERLTIQAPKKIRRSCSKSRQRSRSQSKSISRRSVSLARVRK